MSIKFDGHVYASESDIPDFGSIENVGHEGKKREYVGFVEDESKLPTYDDLATDSSATLYNQAGGIEKLLTYFSDQKKWVEK